MSMEPREKVVAFLSTRGEIPGATEEERMTYEYVDRGLLDSFGIVEMVMELESEYGIRFSPADMQSPEFRTVGGLVRVVERLRTGADGS